MSNGYTITKVMESCNSCKDGSTTVCTKSECQFLCWHMYTCDQACYDYNNGHICRHIHRIHSTFSQVTQTSDISTQSLPHATETLEETIIHTTSNHEESNCTEGKLCHISIVCMCSTQIKNKIMQHVEFCMHISM